MTACTLASDLIVCHSCYTLLHASNRRIPLSLISLSFAPPLSQGILTRLGLWSVLPRADAGAPWNGHGKKFWERKVWSTVIYLSLISALIYYCRVLQGCRWTIPHDSLQYTTVISTRTDKHARAHTHTHTKHTQPTHKRARARTHTHTHTHTHTGYAGLWSWRLGRQRDSWYSSVPWGLLAHFLKLWISRT